MFDSSYQSGWLKYLFVADPGLLKDFKGFELLDSKLLAYFVNLPSFKVWIVKDWRNKYKQR